MMKAGADMKKILKQMAGVSADDMKSDAKLGQWIEGIRRGELEDMAWLLLSYSDIVVSVSKDVLKDEALAKEAACETMRTVIRTIQKRAEVGRFEPWLMWLTRSIALQYLDVTSAEKPVIKDKQVYIKPEEKPVIKKTEHMQRKNVLDFNVDSSSANMTPLVLLKSERAQGTMSWDEPEEEPEVKKTVSYEDQAESLRKKMAQLKRKTKESFSDEEPEEPQETEIEKGYTEKINFKNAKKSTNGYMVAVNIGLVAVCTLLLWVLIGLAAKKLGLNVPDLGYSWFNSHLFSLF